MIVVDCEQGSDAWALARCGLATASEFSSILAKGQGKMRTAYLRRLVAERLTGKPIESQANGSWAKHMERGNEQEEFARAAYEIRTGNSVDRVGFVRHDTIMAGCSPDGAVGSNRGVEIKCVIPTVQLETILSGSYPPEHKAQIQGSLWLCEREWWDFCSYSPDMPENLRTYIYPVQRDEAYIRQLQAETVVFLREVDALVEQLRGLK